MSQEMGDLMPAMDRNAEQAARIMDKLFAAAQPGAVFGEPVTSGNYTVITASEVGAGGGFGSGGGLGPSRQPGSRQQEGEGDGGPQSSRSEGAGFGGGGGGGSGGRPVAAIVIGPDGVTVRPILDVNKVLLAAISAWGAMAIALGRMRKANKG